MALSYCWTTANPDRTILVSGQEFQVRPNLYHYLQQVQKESRHDWMFIDAICIDQTNPTEKSTQIRLMGDVYRSAKSVEIWLGIVRTSDDYSARRLQDDANRLDDLDLHPENPVLLVPAIIDHMYSSQYWTRLWIVQEVLLARTLVIRFGPLRVPWDTFTASLIHNYNMHWDSTGYVAFYPDSANAVERATTSAFAIIQQIHRSELRDVMRLPLPRVLAPFSHQACTKPRDRVFGLIGLSVNCVTIDYTAPLSELYIRTLLECSLQIDILSKLEGVSIAPEWGISRFLLAFTEGFGWHIDHPTLSLLIYETTGKLLYVILDQILAGFGRSALAKRGIWGHMLNFFYFKLPKVSLQFVFVRSLAKYLTLAPRLFWSKYRDEVMCMPGTTQDARTCSEWIGVINSAKKSIERSVYTREYLQQLLASTGCHELVMNGRRYSQLDAVEALLDEYERCGE